MKTHTDIITNSKITLACFVLLLGSIILYLYFLNMSVVQVVLRTEATQQQNKLHAEIAQLETKYIEFQHHIAERVAVLDEYRVDTPKSFVSRSQTSLVVSSE